MVVRMELKLIDLTASTLAVKMVKSLGVLMVLRKAEKSVRVMVGN